MSIQDFFERFMNAESVEVISENEIVVRWSNYDYRFGSVVGDARITNSMDVEAICEAIVEGYTDSVG